MILRKINFRVKKHEIRLAEQPGDANIIRAKMTWEQKHIILEILLMNISIEIAVFKPQVFQ